VEILKCPTSKTKDSTAFILIDMQTKLVKKLRLGDADRIIPNQLSAIRHCNQFGIPIIVLELYKEEFDRTIDVLINEIKGNPNFYIIEKKYDSGFAGTNLDDLLRHLNAKKLFIAGIYADLCVKATASSALNEGYEIFTSNQVIAGRADHSKDNNMRWFRSNAGCTDDITELINPF